MNKILQSLAVLLTLSVASFGQGKDPEIFLKGIPSGFEVVDMDQDQDGNTYVLGSRSGTGRIVKYDSSGNTNPDEDIVISGFIPVAFDVVGDELSGSIFVASSQVVYKHSLATGTRSHVGSVGFADITDLAFASASRCCRPRRRRTRRA